MRLLRLRSTCRAIVTGATREQPPPPGGPRLGPKGDRPSLLMHPEPGNGPARLRDSGSSEAQKWGPEGSSGPPAQAAQERSKYGSSPLRAEWDRPSLSTPVAPPRESAASCGAASSCSEASHRRRRSATSGEGREGRPGGTRRWVGRPGVSSGVERDGQSPRHGSGGTRPLSGLSAACSAGPPSRHSVPFRRSKGTARLARAGRRFRARTASEKTRCPIRPRKGDLPSSPVAGTCRTPDEAGPSQAGWCTGAPQEADCLPVASPGCVVKSR